MSKFLEKIPCIQLSEKHIDWFARISIFLVYFWFGGLKLLGESPAEKVVFALHEQVIPFVPQNGFFIFLGASEVVIGLLFLVPKLTKIAVPLQLGHMFTTMLPLILLPSITWENFPSMTLEGQYIFKNLVLIALALSIYSRFTRKKS